MGKKMPVAVVLGGDPVYTYSATAPLPDNLDEYLLAGFLRKKRVDLVKCITQDIEVPTDADFVIEGYIDPEEDFIWEGPFGDHTGFYSLADWYPRFHVTCITHRKDAVYPATIVGVPPMEDAWIGKATERIFLAPIKLAILPEIIDYNLPFEGVAHNISIVKIKKTYPGQAFKVMNALWGAGQMMFNKIMFVIDQNIDITNYSELIKQVVENVEPDKDILFMSGPLDVLDHSSSKFTYGSKLGIDATIKLEEELSENTYTSKEKFVLDYNSVKDDFVGITELNSIYKGILICSIKKESKEHISNIAHQMANCKEFDSLKFFIFVDEMVDVHDLNMITWLGSGNIDPKRDSIVIKAEQNKGSKIFIDATRKSLKRDNFKRDWPNIVVSDEKTIEIIDKKWQSLGLGDFIKSPSLKYKTLNFNKGAIAQDQ
jgi:4-hydroxy-3-polyprenylbenzoate decarboxylase